MIKILMLFAVLFSGCPSDIGKDGTGTDSPAAIEPAASPDRNLAPKDSDFQPADGIAVFIADGETLKKAEYKIRIFGSGGSVLKMIDYRDDSLESLEGEEGDFYPFDFSNGASREFALELRVTGRSRNWIRVVVHESHEPPAEGFIRAADPMFNLLTWEEWVLDHFNIRFDETANPVVESPDGPPKSVGIPEEPLIKPDEVRGEWVRIRWTRHEPDEPTAKEIAAAHPENYGWIRWRADGKILIREYYP